jgi:chemosensory pili system protein ChpA (sensor histidine kinase/response regulator)
MNMTRNVDEQVLQGFIDEAKSYLPSVRDGIQAFQSNPEALELLEEAYRYMHTIKGASSMVGLNGLSQSADSMEQILDELLAGHLVMSDEGLELLLEAVSVVEKYLDSALSDDFDVQALQVEINSLCIGAQEHCQVRSGASKEEDQSPGVLDLQGMSGEIQPEPLLDESQLDDISPELMQVFSMEAEDHLRNISMKLEALKDRPEDKEMLQEIRRTVHTLKGAAGAVGFHSVSELAHRMEDLLDQIYDGWLMIDAPVLDLLFDSSDALEDISRGEPLDQTMRTHLKDLYIEYDSLVIPKSETGELEALAEITSEPPVLNDPSSPTTSGGNGKTQPAEESQTKAAQSRGEVMRVPLSRLDDLVRMVSELVINRTAFEQRMADFKREVEELQLSSDRLRKISTKLDTDFEVSALGGRLSFRANDGEAKFAYPFEPTNPHGFDELEFDQYTEFHLLSRELIEATSDIRTVGHHLTTLIGDFEGMLNRQGRLSSDIQDRLMHTRMVPLGTLSTRLRRAVRVIAREQSKSINLFFTGENIELDKSVLDDIADPLLHLMRNAIDHGIESQARRQALEKPEQGTIKLQAHYEGNQIVIRISDDGAGMDPATLRSAAVKGGFASESEAAHLSDEELFEKVFLPGFTTATEISEVSGRGVGLDIVKTTVQKLKGSIRVESKPGEGATFTIRLPMTMAVMQALLVRAHKETFALPLDVVTNILRIDPSEIEEIGESPVLKVEDHLYPLIWLGEALNLSQPVEEIEGRAPVLIMQIGDQSVGLLVDELVGGREIVIKSLGSHLRHVHGIAGATLMGDGSVVLILNPGELLYDPPQGGRRGQAKPPTARDRQPDRYTIMVVDDSLSVRRVVSNLIKSAGWQPVVAKDGLEALEMLQQMPRDPDLILVDIEMPRMDGYELMSTLKAGEEYHEIPLVVLTSRAGAKHRRKAMSIGAVDYIVKPYQDEVMLATLEKRIEESRRSVLA